MWRLLHRYTSGPHATSKESLLHLYGAREYACMMKSVPVSLAFRSSLSNVPLILLSLVALISFLMSIFWLGLWFRVVILWRVSYFFGVVFLNCGHLRRPPKVKMMSGRASPSTTTLAALSTNSLYSMSVCDLTLPMCVWSCFESIVLNSWSMNCSRSLCRWWL